MIDLSDKLHISDKAKLIKKLNNKDDDILWAQKYLLHE